MTKMIPLTRGKFALVDDEDFDWLSQWKWHIHTGYAARVLPKFLGKRKVIWMHREIAKTPDGMDTDHINLNKLDNRRENLRACSHSENKRNQGPQSNNASGRRGVHFNKWDRKWQARIKANGKNIHLGSFDSADEAALAYDAAARKYFGEFANLNFP